ncbi:MULTISPECIES: hypothetical protein [unclassified Luteibacter]|uniref:hypothetical protein n=1 Tax=unclassified Luteibacter TaxID=2620188 RepID=UPI001113B223|nr:MULTISPECIES: hypothetical protein [unclassified Luteibacter]MDR6935698.1 hypothetical protein [Luteibacter sp. 3190]
MMLQDRRLRLNIDRDEIRRGCPVTEYRYTANDRVEQLRALEQSLVDLIPLVEAIPAKADLAPRYRCALEEVRALMDGGFEQGDLSQLSRAIPDAFPRHKDWIPPLELSEDGHWQEPEWFKRLESKLAPVLNIAAKLRVTGFY